MITQAQMKQALVIIVMLIAIARGSLISVAYEQPSDIIGFLVLGVLSIITAITYTVGTKTLRLPTRARRRLGTCMLRLAECGGHRLPTYT